MNEHRSCRIRSAYILAGEGISAFRSVRVAPLHPLISRSEDFDVGFTERILCGSNCRRAAFDFIDPIEKLRHSVGIATRGFFG